MHSTANCWATPTMERTAKLPSTRPVWRMLESPLVTQVVGESVFDFYARLLSPRITARRIVARIEAVRVETQAVKSFVLSPNGHFTGFRPGQHVPLTVEIDGVRHTRCYSPSNAPDANGTVVLTVKRHPHGRVSPWLHEYLRPGHWVELGPASGDFTLPRLCPEKLLFIAGGSGITPIASMLRQLCNREQACDVVLLAYNRTRSDLIFAQELKTLPRRHPGLRTYFATTRDGSLARGPTGRLSPAHLHQVAPDVTERHTFVCGPRPLIDRVRAFWAERGIKAPLQTETFAPPEMILGSADEASATVRVSAARTARHFSANAATSLLVQAERAGLAPKSGCRQGICFSCTCRKRSGVVRNLLTGALSSEAEEDIRLCVSAPLSDLTLDL